MAGARAISREDARYLAHGVWVAVALAGLLVGTARAADTRLNPYELERFTKELESAFTAPDRDAQVERMRQAVAAHSGHPYNIMFEFHMGILLSQHSDAAHGQETRPAEALPIFERILEQYNHMDYYEAVGPDGIDSPQFMVPDAAIQAACLRRRFYGDKDELARSDLHRSMEWMQMTYERRKEQWANEPPPPEVLLNEPFGGEVERSKWMSRMHLWEERRNKAATGDVFNLHEMASVQAAVRQFGYPFGPQRVAKVTMAMEQIIRDFPDTPMAKVAQGHIDRAKDMAAKQGKPESEHAEE